MPKFAANPRFTIYSIVKNTKEHFIIFFSLHLHLNRFNNLQIVIINQDDFEKILQLVDMLCDAENNMHGRCQQKRKTRGLMPLVLYEAYSKFFIISNSSAVIMAVAPQTICSSII